MTDIVLRALIQIGESPELSLVLKATIVMVLGLGAAQLATRARASLRHLLLASTFGALLTLPAALILVPAAAVPIRLERASDLPRPQSAPNQEQPESIAGRRDTATGSAGIARSSVPSLPALLRFGWALGTVLLLVSLGVSLWKLGRIRRRAYPWIPRNPLVIALIKDVGVSRSVELVLHEELAAPLTCGSRRPVVILPSDAATWSDADIHRALVHELEHIRRNDWALQLLARVTCALYWFHPLVWKLWRQFCLDAERACDDAVLTRAEHTDYADQLVQLARRMSSAPIPVTLTMASRSDLSTRVSAILDGKQKRGPVGVLPGITAMTAAVVAALAMAPVRAIEAPRLGDSMQPVATEQARQISQTATRQDPPRRPRGLDRALFEAAHSGDIDDMTALLNAGANANAAIPGDGSPLIGAASRGHSAALRFLLDQGADPNLAVSGDGTALIAASRAGHTEAVALLLDRGADLEQVVPGDENALIQASGSGRLDVAELLVSRGANVNAGVWADRGYASSSGEWRSPLSMAKRGRHQAVVEYLISRGAIE
jgi:beta-lactamase regulating signal transducer with metallopeptidase domain